VEGDVAAAGALLSSEVLPPGAVDTDPNSPKAAFFKRNSSETLERKKGSKGFCTESPKRTSRENLPDQPRAADLSQAATNDTIFQFEPDSDGNDMATGANQSGGPVKDNDGPVKDNDNIPLVGIGGGASSHNVSQDEQVANEGKASDQYDAPSFRNAVDYMEDEEEEEEEFEEEDDDFGGQAADALVKGLENIASKRVMNATDLRRFHFIEVYSDFCLKVVLWPNRDDQKTSAKITADHHNLSGFM
jgi:hypothetical protein